MGLIRTLDITPNTGIAGAAHAEYIMVQLDPDLMEQMDCDADDVTLVYDIYGASDGLVKKTGPLVKVATLADDFVYSATANFLLAEALAGAYLVKVRVTTDVDFGDDATQDVIDSAGGTELDSDDIGTLSRLFSLK